MDLKNFKSKFEHEAVKIMRDLKIPGISVLITKDGKTLYQRSFGIVKKVDVKPATADTLYGVSSITKSVTCMGILQLHQEGKLNINDPVSKYIPFSLGLEDDPIRIHHLMSHSSGIPSLMTFYFSQMNQQLYKAKAPTFPMGNWDDFYFHINNAQSEVLRPPKTKYYYWNAGFSLLGQIIEKISGKKFEDYITENILKPLNMNRSTFFLKDLKDDQDVSRGYNTSVRNEEFERQERDLLTGPFIAGSGGLISSVKEITNYLLCNLNGGEFKGTRVLDETLTKEMWKEHNTNFARTYDEFCPNVSASYGYGWRIYDNFFGHRLITHGGQSGVSGGYIGFAPELNITYAQLQNVNWTPSHLMLTAFALLIGEDPEEVMPYYKRRKHYKSLCGKYEAYKKTISMEIIQKDSLLYLTSDNWFSKFTTPLIPRNDDPEVMDFYIMEDSGTMNVPFTKHSDGQITLDWERHLMHKVTTEKAEE
ncbi:MAG: serine hydrolase [Asgard group archaeon]|nr:serine hydrolase [Asgard group archaeon]